MPFVQSVLQDFIGSGLTFPIKLENGRAITATGKELVVSSIKIIIGWTIPRIMLGEFNSRLDELIEEPNTEVFQSVARTFIIDSVLKWEKRVEQIDAQFEYIGFDKVKLHIYYRLINSPTTESFIYPFNLNTNS